MQQVLETTVFQVPLESDLAIKVEWNGGDQVKVVWTEDRENTLTTDEFGAFANHMLAVSDRIRDRVSALSENNG